MATTINWPPSKAFCLTKKSFPSTVSVAWTHFSIKQDTTVSQSFATALWSCCSFLIVYHVILLAVLASPPSFLFSTCQREHFVALIVCSFRIHFSSCKIKHQLYMIYGYMIYSSVTSRIVLLITTWVLQDTQAALTGLKEKRVTVYLKIKFNILCVVTHTD